MEGAGLCPALAWGNLPGHACWGGGRRHQAPPAPGSTSVQITPSHELPEQNTFNLRLVHGSHLITFLIFETVSPPPLLKSYNGENRA